MADITSKQSEGGLHSISNSLHNVQRQYHKRQQSRQQDNVDVHGPHGSHHGVKGLGFVSPDQVQSKHQHAVMWVGRFGWVGKGILYAVLGGLSVQSAINASDNDFSVSPQGGFVLVGSNSIGIPLLGVLAGCLAMYITWRFWEGITGQGYDAEASNFKNFFKFRLSPMISGLVYCGYLIFILQLIVEIGKGEDVQNNADSDFTTKWKESTAGKVGLCLIGIAFAIGFLVQMDWTLRSYWHKDYRSDMPRWLMIIIFVFGHLGYCGRGAVFLAVSILFFKQVANTDSPTQGQTATIDNALGQLRGDPGLRAVLWILGFFLVLYGTFAVISAWARIFPTAPPSRRPKLRPGEPAVIYDVKGNTLTKARLVLVDSPAGEALITGGPAALADVEAGHAAADAVALDAQAGHAADKPAKANGKDVAAAV